ncbi:MAG: hypothetical protein AAF984_01745 [Verrucomicrobiota bacterium]
MKKSICMTCHSLISTIALALFSVAVATAQPKTLTTLDGQTYENVTLSSVSESTVKLMSPKGIFNVPIGHIKDEDLQALKITADADILKEQREGIKYAIILQEIKNKILKVRLINGTEVDTSSITDLTPIHFTYVDDIGPKKVLLEDMSTDMKKAFGYDKAAAESYKTKKAEQLKVAAQTATSANTTSSSTTASLPAYKTKDQVMARRSQIRTLLRDPKISATDRTKLNQEKLQLDMKLREFNAQ